MAPPAITIVVPAHNEERTLDTSVAALSTFLLAHCPHHHEILIAENGSTDGTRKLARSLEHRHPNVRLLALEQKGRGRALKTAWLQSPADILAYTDADLSSDLAAFPSLIEPLISGCADLAIGSRLLEPQLTTRCFKRELASRMYNLLHRSVLHTHFRDAQCGFKAITRQAAQHLLPLVQDNNWFFDTELLVLAERHGYRIFELPVRWIENRHSHVKIPSTAIEDIRGLLRLRRSRRSQPSAPKNKLVACT